jgi:hypothetical protein
MAAVKHSRAVTGRQGPIRESETAAPLAFASDATVVVPPRGVERIASSSEKTTAVGQGGAESGAVEAEVAQLLARLASLTPAQREVLLALLGPRPASP